MDRRTELEQAKRAAERVLSLIDQATQQLQSAKSWGFWDILGGGFFSSLMKRNKIGEANHILNLLQEALQDLSSELRDVQMFLPKGPSNQFSDAVFDVWFDNIFTDFRVQGEIKETLKDLNDLQRDISAVHDRLSAELRNLN